MTASDPGLVGFSVLAQTTQTPTPAEAQGTAPAPPAGSPGFQVPGVTTPTTTTTQAPGGAATGPSGAGTAAPGMPQFLLPVIVVVALMFLMTSMTGRKERKKREALLSAVKRGDRVQTSGGIIGTITELSDQELTLRVDEATNTRIRFARSAVQSVVKEGKDGGKAELEAKPKTTASAMT
jgi:preprotein translocase subunit YajC